MNNKRHLHYSGYTCDEHIIKYKLVESLHCSPEIKVTLHVNCTSIKKKKDLVFLSSLPEMGTKIKYIFFIINYSLTPGQKENTMCESTLWLLKLLPGRNVYHFQPHTLARGSLMAVPELNRVGKFNISKYPEGEHQVFVNSPTTEAVLWNTVQKLFLEITNRSQWEKYELIFFF